MPGELVTTTQLPREPSDDYTEDYEEDLEPSPYPPMSPQHDNNMVLQEEFSDTTMLDSVILPAIASVRARVL